MGRARRSSGPVRPSGSTRTGLTSPVGLAQRAGRKVTINRPQRGLKLRLLDIGGGYPVRAMSVNKIVASDNYVTFASDYGDQSQYWHGFDINLNARLQNGLTLQGGTSTGRGVRDRCDTVVKIDNPDPRGCRVVEPFLTSLRGLVSYTVPWADVLVTGQFRSLNPSNTLPGLVGGTSATNGASLNANTNIPNTVVQSLLGGMVRHLDAGMACPDVPLCLGRVVPPMIHPLVALHDGTSWVPQS